MNQTFTVYGPSGQLGRFDREPDASAYPPNTLMFRRTAAVELWARSDGDVWVYSEAAEAEARLATWRRLRDMRRRRL